MTQLFAPLLRITGLVLVLGMLAVPGRAADPDKLEAFLEVTGFDVSLESIRLAAEHAPDMLGLDADEFGAAWTQMAAQVFDTEIMHGMAIDMLSLTLSDSDLAHAAGFYASDLGQRLVKVENASHMMEDDDAKRRTGEALVTGYGVGPDSRTALLQQLNEAVDSAGNGVHAIHELQIRFLMAASHAGVLEYQIDEAALRAALRDGEDELRENLSESALYGAAFTYQDISDADLRRYRDALRDPTMQRVYELMNAIQHEITANRFEALAAQLATLTGGQDL